MYSHMRSKSVILTGMMRAGCQTRRNSQNQTDENGFRGDPQPLSRISADVRSFESGDSPISMASPTEDAVSLGVRQNV
eukprot:203934-Amphidinium_carterae.1